MALHRASHRSTVPLAAPSARALVFFPDDRAVLRTSGNLMRLLPPSHRWRRVLFGLHGTFGLVAGAILAVITFTGSLAVFRREIDWLTTPALRVATCVRPRSLDMVHAAALQAHPPRRSEWLWSIQRPEGPNYAYSILFREGDTVTEVFVDPCTGRATGSRVIGLHLDALANTLRQLHVRLFLGVWGRALVGLCGVFLVGMALSGLLLSQRDRGRVLQGRRAIVQKHTHIGWWAFAFHLLLGITGAVLGLEVLPGLLRHDDRSNVVPPAEPRNLTPTVWRLDLEGAVFTAQRVLPGFRMRVLRFAPKGVEVTVYLDHPSPWIARGASEVTVDLQRGKVVAWSDARYASLASRAYDLIDPVHFGYFGEAWGMYTGYLLRILWCAFGLTPTFLFGTGFMLWRRRTR